MIHNTALLAASSAPPPPPPPPPPPAPPLPPTHLNGRVRQLVAEGDVCACVEEEAHDVVLSVLRCAHEGRMTTGYCRHCGGRRGKRPHSWRECVRALHRRLASLAKAEGRDA